MNLLVVFCVVACVQLTAAQSSANSPKSRSDNRAQSEQIATVPLDSNGSSEAKTALPPNTSAPRIAAGDDVEVTVYGAPDLSIHSRVGADGNISMPLIGYVRLADLSSNEAERAIEARLSRDEVLNNPQVFVYVKEYTSGEISVAGEVARPGAYSALGPHGLFDILQDAGGLTEKAGDKVIISHRGSEVPVNIDLPKDPEGLSRLNVELLPGDTVVVPKAGIVYVLGEVNRPGGYVLNSSVGTTVLSVIAAAGGPTRTAAAGGTKMLRRTPNGLQELKVPLKKLLHAKVADIPVQADDIIYIPGSRLKQMLNAGSLVTSAGTAAIYRAPL
jgi:polysaccharide biosynthesis/export protein